MKWTLEQRKDRDGRVKCESMVYENGDMKASIVRGHIYYPKSLVLHCHLLNMDTVDLNRFEWKDGIEEAEKKIKSAVKKLMKDVRDFL